jgi:hypothetical protein
MTTEDTKDWVEWPNEEIYTKERMERVDTEKVLMGGDKRMDKALS